MIVDSSAMLAILMHEPERNPFISALEHAPVRRISAATFVETAIVVEAQAGEGGLNRWEEFYRRADIAIEPFTPEQAAIAHRAWSKYGKGRHPAGLNFGDCFSYALAKALDEPLLYKGQDFSKTDIRSAV